MSAPTVVVGGGQRGLTAAHALRRAGVDVLLIESSGRAGGVAHARKHMRGIRATHQ